MWGTSTTYIVLARSANLENERHKNWLKRTSRCHCMVKSARAKPKIPLDGVSNPYKWKVGAVLQRGAQTILEQQISTDKTFAKEVMISVWWDCRGGIMDLLSHNTTDEKDVDCEQIDRLKIALAEKCSNLKIICHEDNWPAHRAKKTLKLTAQKNGRRFRRRLENVVEAKGNFIWTNLRFDISRCFYAFVKIRCGFHFPTCVI